MKFSKKSIVITLSSILGVGVMATAIAVPIALSSNTIPNVHYTKVVNDFNNEYGTAKSKIDPNIFGNIDSKNQNALKLNAKQYLAKSQIILEEMKTKNLDNSDQAVWLKSLMYNIELEIKAYDVNVRYLGGVGSSPSRSYPISHFRNWIERNANSATSISSASSITETSVTNSIRRLSDYTQYLTTTLVNLKEGLAKGVMFSGVYFTLLMNHLVNSLGVGDLPIDFALFPNATYSIPKLRNGYSLWWPYKVLQDAKIIPTSPISKLPADIILLLDNTLHNESQNAVIALNDFIKYMMTIYADAINVAKYGVSTDFNKKNKTVIENQLSISQNASGTITSVPMNEYGLSLNDLGQKDIGVGFMPNKTSGKQLYEYFLQLSTSTDLKADVIYKRGDAAVKENITQMTQIAAKVADIESGTPGAIWTPTVKYSTDPFKIAPADVILNIRTATNGSIDFNEFNKWLNSEKWFFGRGGFQPNTQPIDEFIYKKLPGLPNVNIRKVLSDNGYAKWENEAAAYEASTTYKDAYIGASESLNSYYLFKDASVATIKEYFNDVKQDYDIVPYNAADVAYEGVGAYSGGSSSFFENVDPYFGLQKWNVSTLSLHEAVPGHHFQDKYYVENKEEGALSFSYTAFAEGWGLFSEWLGVALGIYGEPSKNLNGLPNNNLPDFTKNALGFIPTDPAELAKFQNGVYKTHEEGNALQYFGYLNEQQLRAMRQIIDTGIHAGTNGAYAVDTGWSISQVRDYMSANSALGAGDKQSESKRYLSYVGQATSYYTGKLVLQDLFDSYYNTVKNSGAEFTKDNYKKFFHYVLKNNDIPLAVLEEYVTSNLNFKMGATPMNVSYSWLTKVINEVPSRLTVDNKQYYTII